MAGNCIERIDMLIAKLEGNLHGSVVVDQAYAQKQHEDLAMKHPRGGHAKYLQKPLLDKHPKYLQNIADDVLNNGGVDGMVKSMEDLSDEVAEQAPVDRGNLRQSGHPTVSEGTSIVYDRAPVQRRLTDEELDHINSERNWGRFT